MSRLSLGFRENLVKNLVPIVESTDPCLHYPALPIYAKPNRMWPRTFIIYIYIYIYIYISVLRIAGRGFDSLHFSCVHYPPAPFMWFLCHPSSICGFCGTSIPRSNTACFCRLASLVCRLPNVCGFPLSILCYVCGLCTLQRWLTITNESTFGQCHDDFIMGQFLTAV